MLASEIREWAAECSGECDAEVERITREALAGRRCDLGRIALLSQAAVLAYALEAVGRQLEAADPTRRRREVSR